LKTAYTSIAKYLNSITELASECANDITKCKFPTDPVPTPPMLPNRKRSTPLYDQGYAKGVADAKLVLATNPPSGTMNPGDVDCDNEIDPQMDNEEYCSGYQQGFVDTNNNALIH
jgi:hypothetical protein